MTQMIDINQLLELAMAGDPDALAILQQLQLPQVVAQQSTPIANVRSQQMSSNFGADNTDSVSIRNGFKSSNSTKLPGHHIPKQPAPTHSRVGPAPQGVDESAVTNYLKPRTSGPTVKPVRNVIV